MDTLETEYKRQEHQVQDLVIMLRSSGQDDLIRQSIYNGESITSIVQALAPIWDVDPTMLSDAIRRIAR